MESLNPMMTPGAPGIDTPITLTPGPLRCTAYQIDGSDVSRCGSLQRMGAPVAVLLPLTAQLLLPTSGSYFGIGSIPTKPSGKAGGTSARLTASKFQPPGLLTIGSMSQSGSGYSRSTISLPNSVRALVISMSLLPMLSVCAMLLSSSPHLSTVQGSGS